MAFKLTKAQRAEHAQLVTKLEAESSDFAKAVQSYNDSIEKLNEEMEGAVATYNETIVEIHGFIEGVKDDWQSEYDDKSEKWQDGDKANSARELIEAWETALETFADMEYQPLDTSEFESVDAEVLGDLPSEAE